MTDNMMKYRIMDFALQKYVADTAHLYFHISELPNSIRKHKKQYISTIAHLGALGYLELLRSDTKQIKISSSGFGIAISKHYLKEEQKFWKSLTKDILLVGCNIAVAIAAIIALNKDATNEKRELKALKSQVDSILLQSPQKSKKADTVYYLRLDTTFHPH